MPERSLVRACAVRVRLTNFHAALASAAAGVALLGAPVSAQTADPEAGPGGRTICGDHPCASLLDGDLTISPGVRIDLDGGGFFDQPGGRDDFRSGVDPRRARILVHGRVAKIVGYDFTYDFGGSSGNRGKVQEALVTYAGVHGLTLRAGAFQLNHLLEYAGSSFQVPFLERASITNIAASIGSGARRWAGGGEAHGARWLASLYVSGGTANIANDGRQRAIAGRAAALVVDTPAVQLQIGIDGVRQFRRGLSTRPGELTLSDDPEVRLSSADGLTSQALAAQAAYAVGPEFAGRLGPVYAEAAFQHIGVEESGRSAHGFDGWYATVAWPLLGHPRSREEGSASWLRPNFTPDATGPAVEVAGRYSVADLRWEGHGNRQALWTGALNWYPSQAMRLTAEYGNGRLDGTVGQRGFQFAAARMAFSL